MKPHIWNSRPHPNAGPRPFHIMEMPPSVLAHKHIGIPVYPGNTPEHVHERVRHGQEMRAPRLGLRDPPFCSRKTYIIPPHGQHLGASGAGQERSQQDSADREVRFFSDGVNEPGEFLWLNEPITRFFSKEWDAGRGILSRIEAPVPSQI